MRLAPQDDFLLAAAAGQVSTQEVIRLFKNAIDTATERGVDKILIDFLAVTGELSAIDLYEIGETMAKYCVSKSILPKVAVIGRPPTVVEFGALVASNRGLTSKTFSEQHLALNWLRAFGSAKASGS